MKTKRRHDLQTNMLADYLGKHLQQAQPYYKHITIGAVLVAVLGFGALYYTSAQRTQSGKSWSDYFDAFGQSDAASLEEVAKLHGGTKAAWWAQQSAGDIKLATGAGQLFTDRQEAEKSLKDAEKLYLAVEQEAADEPALVQRSCYGLGQVYECLFKIEKAQQYYEKAAQAAPDSALGKAARRRVDQLTRPSLQRWYAWFERQQPALPGGATTDAGAGPSVSDQLDALSDRPDLSFPGSDIAEQLKDAKPGATLPPVEAPADDGQGEDRDNGGNDGVGQPKPAAKEPPPASPDAAGEAALKPAAGEPDPEKAGAEPAASEQEGNSQPPTQ